MTQTLPPAVPPSASPPTPAPAIAKFAPSAAAMEPEHDWGVAFSVVDRTRAHVEGAFRFCLAVVFVYCCGRTAVSDSDSRCGPQPR
jgi:hypothetical protein